MRCVKVEILSKNFLYPSIRVRTAIPVSVRVRATVKASLSFSWSAPHLQNWKLFQLKLEFVYILRCASCETDRENGYKNRSPVFSYERSPTYKSVPNCPDTLAPKFGQSVLVPKCP